MPTPTPPAFTCQVGGNVFIAHEGRSDIYFEPANGSHDQTLVTTDLGPIGCEADLVEAVYIILTRELLDVA